MATLPCTTAVTWLGRLALACVPVPFAPIRLQHWLATPHQQRHNAPVPFNSGTGIGVPNPVADSRLAAFFMSVCNTIGASFLWRAMVGACLHAPVSTGPVRQSRHAPATPDWRREAGLNDQSEATMPNIALRVVRALFPVFSVPVSTVPTHAQACAMARLLVSQGKRVAIAPAAQGFTVLEVKA